MSELRVVSMPDDLILDVAGVIAEAFRGETLTNYQLDLSDDRTLRTYVLAVEARLALHRQAGHHTLVALDDERTLGVALIKRPWLRSSFDQQLRVLLPRLPRLPRLLSLVPRYNLQALRNMAAARNPVDLPEPYYTLEVLAVRPDAQGCGIGRTLMQEVMILCGADAAATGIYLYTGEARTRDYYYGHGFGLVRETAAGPVKLYHMFHSLG
jgi:GNAT superfamily N-acetyltransferase